MEESSRPFGLSETQLLSVLEAVAGTPLAGFTVQTRPAVQDVPGGNKRLLTFLYTTRDGMPGEATLFAKRCVWKGRSEAVHYRHLAARGVPTARLYGALRDGGGEEVVFLERLTEVGFRDDSEVEWRSLLSLLAWFNACGVTPDYAPHLHPYEQVGNLGGGIWIIGLGASPMEEQVAADLQASGVGQEDRPALQQAARTLFGRVAAHPQGLLHQDFRPDNVGWRGGRAEMVVFDLHKNALGPRFADVAPYLASPDWSDSRAFLDGVGRDGSSRRETLTRHYLDEYARFGGPAVSPATFREETTALFWMHKVSALGCLVEQNQQERIRETLDALRQTRGPYASDSSRACVPAAIASNHAPVGSTRGSHQAVGRSCVCSKPSIVR